MVQITEHKTNNKPPEFHPERAVLSPVIFSASLQSGVLRKKPFKKHFEENTGFLPEYGLFDGETVQELSPTQPSPFTKEQKQRRPQSQPINVSCSSIRVIFTGYKALVVRKKAISQLFFTLFTYTNETLRMMYYLFLKKAQT